MVRSRGLENLSIGVGLLSVAVMTAFAIYAGVEELIEWRAVPVVAMLGLVAASPLLILGQIFRSRRIREEAALAEHEAIIAGAPAGLVSES